ncbi:MAG: hypothetical protein MJE77_26010 [Proteobacteria bacterium]|nr:hypothetical protein [Pseudomonadota bacterium]
MSHRAYVDATNTMRVKYAYRSPAGQWQAVTVEDLPVDHTAIAVDSQGVAYIAYSHAYDDVVKLARQSGDSFLVETVAPGTVSSRSAVAVGDDGVVHLAFYDVTSRKLMYAEGASGAWTVHEVEPNSDEGLYHSIDLAPDNSVHIVYGSGSNSPLKHATRSVGGLFHTTEWDPQGGFYPWLAVDPSGALHALYPAGVYPYSLTYARYGY